MKKSEIATVIFVAGMSVIVAYFIADAVIGKPSSKSESVPTIKEITAAITEPDKTIFNSNAINPTVEVVIGNQ